MLRQDQRMSRVPRTGGEETKFVPSGGSVQLGVNVVGIVDNGELFVWQG